MAALPDGISRSRKATPINLFEAISVGSALALRSGSNIDHDRVRALLSDEELKRFTGAGSNAKKMVIGRIEYTRDKLL